MALKFGEHKIWHLIVKDMHQKVCKFSKSSYCLGQPDSLKPNTDHNTPGLNKAGKDWFVMHTKTATNIAN